MATFPQGPGPGPGPGAPQNAGAAPAPPPTPPPPPPRAWIDPITAPRGQAAYLIDPLVMEREVSFVVNAADRMVSREKLQQAIPAIFQTYMNPAFMKELGGIGQTVDVAEVTRLVGEATGLGRTFRLVRPLSPQEQQSRMQPPPEAMTDMQKAQLESQTRIQMGQLKAQSELQIAQIEAMIRNKEIDEASGLKIMELFQRENSDAARKPDPQAAQMELQAEIQKKQMELKALERKYAMEAQRDQQKLGLESQKMQLEGQRDRQKLGMDVMRMRMQAAMANQRPNTAAERTKSEKPA